MKSIVKSIIKYLLKKPNYLKKAIWFTSFFIIREVGAIGSKQDWIELSSEFRDKVELAPWEYWGLRILEVALIGGNWFVFGTLLLLLAIQSALLIATKKSKPVVIGKHHYNSQLRTIEEFIQTFKPISAFQLAQKALQDVDDSYLTVDEKNELYAKIYWLIGRCRSQSDSVSVVYESHVKSFQFEITNKIYKERACVSFYFLGKKEEAQRLATELLNEDLYSERASAVALMLNPNFKTELERRAQVMNGQNFRRIYVQMLMQGKQEEEAFLFLGKEFTTQPIPNSLDFSNIDYWESVGRYAFMKGLKMQPNIFITVKEDYSENKLIKYGHQLLGIIHERIKDTEAIDTLGYQITIFYYFYADYLLTRDIESVRSMRSIVVKLPQARYQVQYLDVIFCFNQLEEYQETLNLATQLKEIRHPFFPLMKYMALRKLDQDDKAEKAFIEYIQLIPCVGDLDVNNLLTFFDDLEKEKIPTFYQTHIHSIAFESELNRKLVFCYSHRYLPEFATDIESHAPLLVESYPTLRLELRHVILITLQAIGKRTLVNELIEKYHNWKIEELPLKIYTINLIVIREEGQKITEVLKHRRSNFPEERLFLEELKIHSQVDNTEEVLQLTEAGLKLYPENANFRFSFIHALYKKDKKEVLEKNLTEDLLSVDFAWKQKYVIAKICTEHGKVDLGFELFYRETIKNYSSPAIKEHYFALILLSGTSAIWPPIVELDTYILIEVNRKQNILDINQVTVDENIFAKGALGHKAQDVVEVKVPHKDKAVNFTILHIYDKYSGLANKIRLELENSEVSGMNFRSIQIPGSNPEDFTKKLIEEFGESGDARQNSHKEAIENFNLGKITFSDLVRLSYNKVFDVYSLLTSPYSEGFRTIPLKDFETFKLPQTEEVLIDLTSLPILFEISEKFPNLLARKFIISQYAIDYVLNELEETRSYPQEKMTVVITSSAVRPHIQAPDTTKQQIDKLERMVAWIKEKCETRFSPDRLNMSLKHPELVRENDFYYNYLIDTAFLSTGRLLVSDDAFYYKLPSGAQTISLEFYLSHFYKDVYRNDLLPILISHHYIGLRVFEGNLKNEFKKPVFGGKSTYDYCLENLPFTVNHDETVIHDCIGFVKFLYAESMPLQAKKEYSRRAFVYALKKFPNVDWLKKEFPKLIKTKFHLLQNYIPEVMDDAIAALQILNPGHKFF